MTIAKLFKMYKSEYHEQKLVSFSKFQRIFAKEFNIGSGTPAADVCGYCTILKNDILQEKDQQKKIKLQTEKRIDKLLLCLNERRTTQQ